MTNNLQNCQTINFLEWVIDVLHAKELNRVEKLVAIAAVALQDAHNDYLMKRCDVGRTALLSAKRRLRDSSWIQLGKAGGRGKPTKIIGTSPDGKICDLKSMPERVSENEHCELADSQNSNEKECQKGFEKGAKRVSKRVSERVSDSDTCPPPSSPQRNIYSNPPPTSPTPSIPQTGDAGDFWSVLKNDDYDSGVRFENGRVWLVNGARQLWLQRFGSEERLQIVLDGLPGKIRPNSGRPLEQQVIAILSEKAADKMDRDNRYREASEKNRQNKSPGVDDEIRRMREMVGQT